MFLRKSRDTEGYNEKQLSLVLTAASKNESLSALIFDGSFCISILGIQKYFCCFGFLLRCHSMEQNSSFEWMQLSVFWYMRKVVWQLSLSSVRKMSSPQKETPYSLAIILHCFLPDSWQLIYFMFLWICPFWTFYIIGITQYVAFCYPASLT